MTSPHAQRPVRRLRAPSAWVRLPDGERLIEDAAFDLDASGTIRAIGHAGDELGEAPALVEQLGQALVLPGLVNAHSHAFQRAIRGVTQRRDVGDPSDFWSWRRAMYAAAQGLDPDEVYAITRRCYAQMLAAGITCVGEFHYLHHQPDGRPYASANRLGEAVVAAATELGMRIALLEVAYERAGADAPPLPEQLRFCDKDVEHYLARVDDARTRLQVPGRVHVGVAPHSIRAVGARSLKQIASYANAQGMVVHSHVSEQPRENEACQTEHGCTPTALLARCGLLDRPGTFTAVHAIHLADTDYDHLAGQNVCACPSTEADLGDGIVPADKLRARGTSLCLGSDSNARIDLVAEAAALEMNLRLYRQRRLVLADDTGAVAPTLARAATQGGARALGFSDLGVLEVGRPFDAAIFDLQHVQLRDLRHRAAFDALMTGGDASACAQSWVGGTRLR